MGAVSSKDVKHNQKFRLYLSPVLNKPGHINAVYKYLNGDVFKKRALVDLNSSFATDKQIEITINSIKVMETLDNIQIYGIIKVLDGSVSESFVKSRLEKALLKGDPLPNASASYRIIFRDAAVIFTDDFRPVRPRRYSELSLFEKLGLV